MSKKGPVKKKSPLTGPGQFFSTPEMSGELANRGHVQEFGDSPLRTCAWTCLTSIDVRTKQAGNFRQDNQTYDHASEPHICSYEFFGRRLLSSAQAFRACL